MSSLNKVTIIGKLGKDPEVRTMQNGGTVVSFSVACSESWKDKNTGEKKEVTEWVKVVIFNERLAGVAERFLKKGSSVYIEGKLKTRKWEKDGVDHYTTEVVLQQYNGEIILLGGKPAGQGDQQTQGQTQNQNQNAPAGNTSFADDLDDDIPF